MKRLKSIICIIMVLCFCISISNIYAENNDLAATSDQLSATSAKECIGLETSTSSVIIESNGYSEFIDAIATLEDNSEKNVNYDAVWETDNPDVAIVMEGRILAEGKGHAKIKVSYGGFERFIDVQVLKEVDLIKEAKALNQKLKNTSSNSNSKSISTFSLTSNERQAIYDRAMTMLSYVWTPTKNLSKRGGGVFTAGTSYLGLPYTQEKQVDRNGFIAAMSYSDFYTPQPYYDTKWNLFYQPKYGNDCSGFTSFSWGILRQTTLDFYNGLGTTYPKVGSYNENSPSTTDLLASYQLLQMGDAVVYRNSAGGHVFLISVNFTNESRVQAFEQAGPVCSITYWTYSQLASQKYMPFTLNK
ncbi:hypothetical protein EHE19_004150 [Ruminiclostridium herbifermentans]|uniref:Uncharacterized protein n=1 Tax=Ruminiclostridium herbifermentans TaxID=2488810 RepID=A0A4U7JFF0_9FIRM|nr:hypothetical protein [Ruminiclostridium herbifermentans]QNU67673.1 hypothetical protein EHE19_004150 [Ruminiclostridium herbifermentans]